MGYVSYNNKALSPKRSPNHISGRHIYTPVAIGNLATGLHEPCYLYARGLGAGQAPRSSKVLDTLRYLFHVNFKT